MACLELKGEDIWSENCLFLGKKFKYLKVVKK